MALQPEGIKSVCGMLLAQCVGLVSRPPMYSNVCSQAMYDLPLPTPICRGNAQTNLGLCRRCWARAPSHPSSVQGYAKLRLVPGITNCVSIARLQRGCTDETTGKTRGGTPEAAVKRYAKPPWFTPGTSPGTNLHARRQTDSYRQNPDRLTVVEPVRAASLQGHSLSNGLPKYPNILQ